MHKAFVIIFLVLSQHVISQDLMHIGLSVQSGASGLRGNNVWIANPNADLGFNYAIGLHLKWIISERIVIHANSRYDNRTMNTVQYFPNEGFEIPVKMKYEYYSTQMLYRWQFRKRTKPFVEVGTQIDVLLQQTDYLDYRGLEHIDPTYNAVFKVDGTEAYFPFDLAFAMGFGVTIPVGQKLIFEPAFRGSIGLVNIHDPETNDDLEARNYNFGLQLGLFYRVF
jgi:hypothetical protein